MGLPDTLDLTGPLAIYSGDTWDGYPITLGRFVGDGALTDGSPLLTSPDADWLDASPGDVGALVVAYEVVTAADGSQSLSVSDLLPEGTTVLSVAGDVATLSANATASSVDTVIGIGALDLTGRTYLAQVRTTEQSSTAVTVPFGQDPANPIRGACLLGPFSPALSKQIADLLHGDLGRWDLEETDTNPTPDVVETLFAGDVEADYDVSRTP